MRQIALGGAAAPLAAPALIRRSHAAGAPLAINVTDPPWNAGRSRTSAFNTTAINEAVAAAPHGSEIVIPESMLIAPSREPNGADPGAYIEVRRAVRINGVNWNDLIPDPAIPSRAPVISVVATPLPYKNFHGGIVRLGVGGQQGRPQREGGHAIRIQAGVENGQVENYEINDCRIYRGKYGQDSRGIVLIHDTDLTRGSIYNMLIHFNNVEGGLLADRIADSNRILNNLFWGNNDVDIHVLSRSAGNLQFYGNNVSTRGGMRIRGGKLTAIQRNVFTQQLRSISPFNAVLDLAGDIDFIDGASVVSNVFQTESGLDSEGYEIGTPRLLRVGHARGVAIEGNNHFRLPGPSYYPPIEFAAGCADAFLGRNIFDIGGAPPWENNSGNAVAVLETEPKMAP